MTPSSYRAAKRWDMRIQLAVLGIVMLYGIVSGLSGNHDSALYSAAGFYFGIGGVQVLSWLCWVIATPNASFRSGRGRYSIALMLVLAITGLFWLSGDEDAMLAEAFGALFVTPVMALAYFVTTVNESKAHTMEEHYPELDNPGT